MTNIIYLVLINLVTPKARAKHEPLVRRTGHWFVHGLEQGILKEHDSAGMLAHPLHWSERERGRERCRIWLFLFLKGMTGALAPFSYLVFQ